MGMMGMGIVGMMGMGMMGMEIMAPLFFRESQPLRTIYLGIPSLPYSQPLPVLRYEPYEPYGDSRSALNDRELYRAAFEYPGDYPGDYPNDYPGDYPNDYPGDYPNDYPNDYNDYPDNYPDYPNESNDANDFYGRPQPREQQRFQPKFREGFGPRGPWGRERPFQAFGARGGWAEGRGPPGSRRLPSLFSHNILPEGGAPAPFRAFPGAFRGLKRFRRGWRGWDGDFRVSMAWLLWVCVGFCGFVVVFPWFSVVSRYFR